MFKFYREGHHAPDQREEKLIGHDRFCQQKVAVPRYRRRRTVRRTQSEVEAAFELTSVTTGIPAVPPPSEGLVTTLLPPLLPGLPALSPSPQHPDLSQVTVLGNLSPTEHSLKPIPVSPKTGIVVWEGSGSETESVCSFAGFLSSLGDILGCGHGRKTSHKYEPSLCSTEMGLNVIPPSRNLLTSTLAQGTLRLERAAAHRICLAYLDSRKGRYVLIDHLPSIGWRGNRLWYLLGDSTVGAERLLSVTPLNARTQPHPLKILLKACQAFQHPYVCPILDLDILKTDRVGQEFGIVVVPVVTRGSLRDVFQRTEWTESWERKWKKEGHGLTEVQVQRLSCQVLEALIDLKVKGLPAGIGVHLHPGNVLVQYGTARFSGLDNILFGHHPIRTSFFKYHLSSDASPEQIDSIAFAHVVFSMCSGYESNSSQLTLQNWTHVKHYPLVCQVLEFILRNPEGRIPSLAEVAQLYFYRTLDLRELRAPPPSTMLFNDSPIPISSIHFLLEYLNQNGSQTLKRTKAKSISSISTLDKNEITETKRSSHSVNLAQRSYSCSTPSIPKIVGSVEGLQQIEVNSNSTTSNTSSVYWTPPNSLG